MESMSKGRWDSLSDVRDIDSTVYVGRLPKRCDVHLLSAVLARAGTVTNLIAARDTYCFAEYSSSTEAAFASQSLNGFNLGGSRICVSAARSLKRIFVGNLSRTLDASTLHTAIAELVGDGLISVELFELSGHEMAQVMGPEAAASLNMPSMVAPGLQVRQAPGGGMVYTRGPAGATGSSDASARPLLHRGFCFVEFQSHEIAYGALRAMLDRTFAIRLYTVFEGARARQAARATGHNEAAAAERAMAIAPSHLHTPALRVDWAEPLPDVPASVMENVRTLYVSNLPPSYADASEDQLAALFASAAANGASVERCKRLKNYAFVHFRSREEAERAMDTLQNHVIAGHAIKIQWSKPPPRIAASAGMADIGAFGGPGQYSQQSNYPQQAPQQQQHQGYLTPAAQSGMVGGRHGYGSHPSPIRAAGMYGAPRYSDDATYMDNLGSMMGSMQLQPGSPSMLPGPRPSVPSVGSNLTSLTNEEGSHGIQNRDRRAFSNASTTNASERLIVTATRVERVPSGGSELDMFGNADSPTPGRLGQPLGPSGQSQNYNAPYYPQQGYGSRSPHGSQGGPAQPFTHGFAADAVWQGQQMPRHRSSGSRSRGGYPMTGLVLQAGLPPVQTTTSWHSADAQVGEPRQPSVHTMPPYQDSQPLGSAQPAASYGKSPAMHGYGGYSDTGHQAGYTASVGRQFTGQETGPGYGMDQRGNGHNTA